MNAPTEPELKAMAFRIKQDTGHKIGHCYELLAKQYGFRTYAAMRADIKQVGALE